MAGPRPQRERLSAAHLQNMMWARDALARGNDAADVRQELMRRGMSEAEAQRIVPFSPPVLQYSAPPVYHSRYPRRTLSRDARYMLYGGLAVIGGVAATIMTFLLSKENEGRFLFVYGPILVGGLYFLRGLYGYTSRD